ncbi:unnamed protein product [Mytilus edulis]|uniref:Uncharacterized protein n=1 Tax=Mytilus edulis TaxID=6550 RepID=A0A8S3SES9_MYTED|nr:unnamed protein product [Mytilus edulis]
MTPLDLLEDECKTTDWYITNDEGNSPLHQAASRGRENMVKALVGLGANVSAVNIEGDTPLHKALDLNQMHYYGKDMVMRVESLVRLGANVSVSNNKGNSPLHQAASSGKENMVKALIRLGANVSAVNIEGDTPLHKSLDLKQMHYCGKDMVMRVESLVRLGANVSISNNKGKTPLDLLEDKCKTDYWYITNDEGNSPLHQAASSGREHLIKALIVLGANVSAVNIEGRTPLHDAALQGNIKLTDILIRNNADVNSTDNMVCYYINREIHLFGSKTDDHVHMHHN